MSILSDPNTILFFNLYADQYNVYGNAEKLDVSIYDESRRNRKPEKILCVRILGDNYTITEKGSHTDQIMRTRAEENAQQPDL